MRASFFIARRIIFPRSVTAAGKSFSMAVLCIAFSLVPLICVLSVSNGLISGMTSRIIGLSSSHLKTVFDSTSPAASSAAGLRIAANKISALNGITNAYPEADISALACGKERREGVLLRAVSPSMFTENSAFSLFMEIEDGSLDGFTEGKDGTVPILLGKKTCQTLGLKIGDVFRIVTASRKGGKVVPKAFSVKLAASVSSGYEELDGTWAFIPLEDAYRKIGTPAVCSVLAETEAAFSPSIYEVQKTIAKEIGEEGRVFRWDEVNRGEYENFASTQAMLICIMFLIVLVASLNISSSLVMLAEERRREINILKCTGATTRTIEAAYILSGGAAGLLGTLSGVPLGLLCAINMNEIVKAIEIVINAIATRTTPIHLMDSAYYLTSIPLDIPLKSVILTVFSTLSLSLIVSLIPAHNAAAQRYTSLV